MKKSIAICVVILINVFALKAQDTNYVTGYAPEFIGKKVTLYTYSDYLTMQRIKLDETIVQEDSLFKLKNLVKSTVQVVIEVGNTETELYLQKERDYTFEYYRPKNAPITFANQIVEVLFYGLESDDINYRVLQYNQWFDRFVSAKREGIRKHGFPVYLDTFKIYAYDAYKDIDAPYFTNYVRYNIALMERTTVKRKDDGVAGRTYLEYIHPYPVYTKNDQYMKFVKSYYSKDFESYQSKIKTLVYMAIDTASPTLLMKALRYDPVMQIPELREMMMVNMLGNSYYKRGYGRKNIVTILDSVSRFSKFRSSAVAAHNMLGYLTKLENGYPAPEIEFFRENGDKVNWITYKGKFVYVNFFASWNESSVTQMKLLNDLKIKYGDYVSFLSFCTDNSREEYDKYIANNKEFNCEYIKLQNSIS